MERPSNVEENKAHTCNTCVPTKVQGLKKFFTVIPAFCKHESKEIQYTRVLD